MLGDAALGIECALEGLRSNPNDQLLRNNLVVGYVRQGNYSAAVSEFQRIREPLEPHFADAVFKATSGMIAFVRGDYEEGRRLYTLATSSGDAHIRSMAAVNWLETEWTFVPASRGWIEKELTEALPRIKDPATKTLARRVVERKSVVNRDLVTEMGASPPIRPSLLPLL
jgi:hypothetical protein